MVALGAVTIASADPSEWNGSTSRPSEARMWPPFPRIADSNRPLLARKQAKMTAETLG